jgi:hypothetical protein
LNSCSVFLCDKNFKDISELRSHKKTEHEFKCQKCDFKVSTNVELMDHMCDKHKIINEFTCEICTVKLKTEDGLKAHKEIFHGNSDIYNCDGYEYKSSYEPDLVRHIASNHMDETPRKFNNREDSRKNNDQSLKNKNNYQNKTLCYFFNYGTCKYGDNCEYVHDEIPPCKYQERCNNNSCSFFHEVNRKSRNRRSAPRANLQQNQRQSYPGQFHRNPRQNYLTQRQSHPGMVWSHQTQSQKHQNRDA